jgi:hypothetical protein
MWNGLYCFRMGRHFGDMAAARSLNVHFCMFFYQLLYKIQEMCIHNCVNRRHSFTRDTSTCIWTEFMYVHTHTRTRWQRTTHKHKADVLNLTAIFKTPTNVWQFQLHGHIKKNFGYTSTYFDNGRSMSSRLHFQQYLRRLDIVENYRPSVTVPEIYGHCQQLWASDNNIWFRSLAITYLS